ncbi:MAG: RluA family pseudouridine synthase [Oscillospiraceae bacterium]|nr:RluA family pseudouridine synthase [Oscillospiraceae bacterium]
MKEFTITKNDAGQRVDKFILKSVPLLPKSLMYKYIRLKRIKLNGKRTDIAARLSENDVLQMYINDEFFEKSDENFSFLKAGKNLDIIYEDENIMLLDKKVGLLSHPDDTEYVDTLITRVQRYLYEKGEYDPKNEAYFAPALVNRIDRNTGGIVIAAKNAVSLRILNEKLKNREINKFYLCVLIGKPPKESDTVTAYAVKDEKKNKVAVFSSPVPGGKTMVTKYRVLKSEKGLSLAEVELLTGRTHQIRAHMAFIGCPLLGDGKYGTNEQNARFGGYKKQFLYSYKTVFDFETDAFELNYLKGKSFEVNDVWFSEDFPEKI